MATTSPALLGAAILIGLVVGPWLARVAARQAARDPAARPTTARAVLFAVVLAALLGGAVLLAGARPAVLALGGAAAAAVVLAAVDLAAHRLPDTVLLPAYAVCAAALVWDAAVLGSWPALLRAAPAAVALLGLGLLVALAVPRALGLGDAKLLGLLGLVLAWNGWGVLALGLFLGLLVGGLASLGLLAARRATWTTAVPFGPPLLLGAVLAVAVTGPVPPM